MSQTLHLNEVRHIVNYIEAHLHDPIDLKTICKAHEICNRFGMDTISAGATIAFAMECFETGLLNSEELDGLEANFGNTAAMLELLQKIARRQGIGNLLFITAGFRFDSQT